MPQPDMLHSFTKTFHRKSYDFISPLRPELSAKGKTVIITAGHTGIGRAITESFAQAGASHIIIIARREELINQVKSEVESKYANSKVHAYAASITDSKRMASIWDEIRQQIAEPDVLVLNAAFIAMVNTDLDQELSDTRSSFETNVVGNLELVRNFVRPAGAGSGIKKTVVDINSAASHVNFLVAPPAYDASKMALARTLLAYHYEAVNDTSGKWPKDLKLVSLHPGAVYTSAAAENKIGKDQFPWDDGSLAGDTVVWLASSESDFLRGRFIWTNWDVQELIQAKDKIVEENILIPGLLGEGEHKVDWPSSLFKLW